MSLVLDLSLATLVLALFAMNAIVHVDAACSPVLALQSFTTNAPTGQCANANVKPAVFS